MSQLVFILQRSTILTKIQAFITKLCIQNILETSFPQAYLLGSHAIACFLRDSVSLLLSLSLIRLKLLLLAMLAQTATLLAFIFSLNHLKLPQKTSMQTTHGENLVFYVFLR